MALTIEQLERRLDRERRARREAEALLEGKSSELYELNRELRSAKERLEQTLELQAAHKAAIESARLKSQFLANMSHEIRTPMNGVLGMLNLLAGTELGGEQREFADTARRSAESLLQLIDDILDFSRIEAGKLAIEYLEFPLRQEIEDVLELLAEKADAKGLELLCEIAPGVPATVVGDSGRIRQVLVNLVGNGLKFTREGEVTLRVSASGAGEGLRVRFVVADTGIGIPREYRQNLFRPFAQADGSTTRNFGGTGLGLSIARELVVLMGGSMGFESKEGEGSTFWFELPLRAGAAAVVSAPAVPLAGLRVLVVDGHAGSRALLQRTLQAWGAGVTLAAGAVQAFQLLQSSGGGEAPFDVALIDIRMAAMDGVELAKRIRASDRWRNLRLVILTGLGQFRAREALAEADVSDYLLKPVRESRLLPVLERIRRGETAAAPVNEWPPAHVSPDSVSGRILIVDDNLVNQRVASALVARMGYSVGTASNGTEAVAAAASGEYQLILMDCQMPLMDGFAATAAIRKLPSEIRNVPIVAVTASAMKGDREICLAAGMNDYMSKPFRPDNLRDVIQRFLPPRNADFRPDALPPNLAAGGLDHRR